MHVHMAHMSGIFFFMDGLINDGQSFKDSQRFIRLPSEALQLQKLEIPWKRAQRWIYSTSWPSRDLKLWKDCPSS